MQPLSSDRDYHRGGAGQHTERCSWASYGSSPPHASRSGRRPPGWTSPAPQPSASGPRLPADPVITG
ncbi:hypothetical protein EYF80_028630 [Liparis tanakae]|uniref:Uncharacterized protein n=1 Tax=Liparis tanakae TaxID=230148 RepID=A0A4Z2H8L9_9TELE|nr:hypothetical protein EYF80_028630 [Liparis tanakae]